VQTEAISPKNPSEDNGEPASTASAPVGELAEKIAVSTADAPSRSTFTRFFLSHSTTAAAPLERPLDLPLDRGLDRDVGRLADPDLARLVERWSTLPEQLRAAVLRVAGIGS
jgi:hypothetical protein